MLSQIWKAATDGDFYRQMADWMSDNVPGYRLVADTLGYTQMRNTEKSTQTQIDYNNYLNAGNERALQDWYKNVGIPQGRTIRYPELSYPGAIYRSNTATTRALYDASTASANYYGNLGYRTAGLYGIAGKLSRSL